MRDLGLLLLRMVAGVTLAAHGYPKLLGGPGKRPPKLLATAMGPNYPAAVERSGPAFAAALEKIYKAHSKKGFYGQGGDEFSLLLGTVALSFGLTGPGRISIHHRLSLKGS